jgi:hypothetical protein
MPKPISQNTLFYGDNLPKSVPGQTFKQAKKVKKKEGKQGELGI